MSELHPIEAGWRKYRNIRNSLDLLAECFEQREAYLRFLRLPEFPPEVVLPMPLVETFVRRRTDLAKFDAYGISTLILSAHVWAAYRESKTIYEIEPSLIGCLQDTPWPAQTPTAALVLRSRCPILALPREGESTRYVAATYDYQVPNPNRPGILMLHLSWFTEALWSPCGTLNLVGDDLAGCARAALPFLRDAKDLGPVTKEPEWHRKLSAIALTVLLYLAGDPDIVQVVHPGEKPHIKPTLQKRDPDRYRDLREPKIHAVGRSFTRALEHWEVEHAKGKTGDGTGQTVRPHMRSAHAHLYWTGEGREVPRVRFLLPISVKGGKLIEEPESPKVTMVR